MKPIQQRRLFFPTTTCNNEGLKEVGPPWNRCFRPWGRIVAILSAALLISCTSLTPDRVNVIAQIAGQAAAEGAEAWLAKHPEQRDAFMIAVARLGAVLATDIKRPQGPQSLEDAAVEFLNGLPTSTLRGKDGEVYVTGDTNGPASLVVWDEGLKKGVEVRGAAADPVVRKIHWGLRRALLPKPPMPPSKLALPHGVVARELEGRSDLVFATSGNVALGILGTLTPTNQLHVTGTPPGPTRVSGLSVASTFDVSLNEHGIQQVNVRWNMDPNASYTVQRMEENKAWEGFATAVNTNAVPTTCLWRTLWHHSVPVGNWRVVR